MKKTAIPSAPSSPSAALTDDAIRDYAFHLYEQSGCTPGRDDDNWHEATAFLNSNIPAHRSNNSPQDHAAETANSHANSNSHASASAPVKRSKRA